MTAATAHFKSKTFYKKVVIMKNSTTGRQFGILNVKNVITIERKLAYEKCYTESVEGNFNRLYIF